MFKRKRSISNCWLRTWQSDLVTPVKVSTFWCQIAPVSLLPIVEKVQPSLWLAAPRSRRNDFRLGEVQQFNGRIRSSKKRLSKGGVPQDVLLGQTSLDLIRAFRFRSIVGFHVGLRKPPFRGAGEQWDALRYHRLLHVRPRTRHQGSEAQEVVRGWPVGLLIASAD